MMLLKQLAITPTDTGVVLQKLRVKGTIGGTSKFNLADPSTTVSTIISTYGQHPE